MSFITVQNAKVSVKDIWIRKRIVVGNNLNIFTFLPADFILDFFLLIFPSSVGR